MKCPICGLDFFLGKCPHNSITLIREVERLKSENIDLSHNPDAKLDGTICPCDYNCNLKEENERLKKENKALKRSISDY